MRVLILGDNVETQNTRQHDGIPTAEMMERHRERGIGRQVVDTGRAVDLLEAARKGDVA